MKQLILLYTINFQCKTALNITHIHIDTTNIIVLSVVLMYSINVVVDVSLHGITQVHFT
jgi:hypothetical protein